MHVANRDLGTIQHIGEHGQISVQMDGAKESIVHFETNQMRHFDHGYAVTSHSSQGLTAERVLVNMNTEVPQELINQRFAYVSVSRASLSSTKVSSDAIQAFFALMSATPEEFAELLKPSRGPNDFTAFRERPLLRALSKLDLIDLWMLAEKFESAPFWQINSILQGKERQDFHSFWGRLFERYICDHLKSSSDGKLNRVFAAPFFAGTTEELSDVVILCGRSAVLIEAKGTTFTARAKYEGDYKLLRRELESKLVESNDRPQAVNQLARNVGRAFGKTRENVEGLDMKYVSSVFPVLVTRDDIGGIAGVNGLLGERFDAILDRRSVSVSVAPLVCLSSEHAEAISAYLSDTSLADILEAHIRANRRGQARYLTMPFFAAPNAVLHGKGERQIPNQVGNFDEIIAGCLEQLGLNVP